MTSEIMELGKALISRDEVFGKRLIEFGSYNINGSYSTFLDHFDPAEYVAVDLQPCDHYRNGEWQPNDSSAKHSPHPCVNKVMDVMEVVQEYGKESFDVVISTEILEHIKDWKRFIQVMKYVLKPNGYLVLSTRSPGFPLHNYPDDHWRFTLEDMRRIFSDFEILAVRADSAHGVFIKTKKPAEFIENDLNFEVHSMRQFSFQATWV